MSLPHFGLILQGPLDSRGFDARPVVAGYLAQCDRLPEFQFSVCLSTWLAAELGTLEPLAARLNVVYNTPPAGRDLHNRRRQVLSSRNGASRSCEVGSPDFLLKLRTDQALNLEAMCRHLVRLQERGELGPETIVAPAWERTIPYYALDFYYGGTAPAVRRFFELIDRVNEAPLQYAAEIDLLLKYFRQLPGSGAAEMSPVEIRRPLYHNPWLWRGRTSERFAEAWRRDRTKLRLFPRAVFGEMLWRGRRGWFEFLPELVFDGEEAMEARPEAMAKYPEPGFFLRTAMACYGLELLVASRLHLRSGDFFARMAERWRKRKFQPKVT